MCARKKETQREKEKESNESFKRDTSFRRAVSIDDGERVEFLSCFIVLIVLVSSCCVQLHDAVQNHGQKLAQSDGIAFGGSMFAYFFAFLEVWDVTCVLVFMRFSLELIAQSYYYCVHYFSP